MRIWSLHPKYLDTKGLVALWRETLLAKHVLEGKTKGYKNHPQLERFKKSQNPIMSINSYLIHVFKEAEKRGYKFDRNKIFWMKSNQKINVTSGQIEYETQHLLNKLKERDKEKYIEVQKIKEVDIHPLFKIMKGEIESWERF